MNNSFFFSSPLSFLHWLFCCLSHNFHELAQKHNGPGPKKTSSLEIKESKSLGVYVKGLHEVVVEDENKILELMNQGIYIFYFHNNLFTT